MKKQKYTIGKYLSNCIAFLAMGPAAMSQIKYVDIDPDVELNGLLEATFIDFDDDGENDLRFLKFSIYNYDFPWGYVYHNKISVGGMHTNSIKKLELAAYTTFYWSAYCECTFYFPYAFSEGGLFNFKQPWENRIYQTLAYNKSYGYNDEHLRDGGAWHPEEYDHYLGFRFTDLAGARRYGWIRCDVYNNGRNILIKDWAMEMEPEHPIVAGSIESYVVGINENENITQESIFSYDKKIFIQTAFKDFSNAEVNIFSLTGEKIYTSKLTQQKTEIDFTKYASGVYVVEIIDGENKFVKKVWVE